MNGIRRVIPVITLVLGCTPVAQAALTVHVEPFGPSAEAIQHARTELAASPALKARVQGGEFRVLDLRMISEDHPGAAAVAPTRYSASVFDYTHNRAFTAVGALDRPASISVAASNRPPLPTAEEFEAAVEVIRQNSPFGADLLSGRLGAYPPMPPLEDVAHLGAGHRIVEVGLWPADDRAEHEIVGVDMSDRKVVRYAGGAPPTSRAEPNVCGLPQGNNVAGSGGPTYQVTVMNGTTMVWSMLVTRPLASSATNGSGVELQNVEYMGKHIFDRAHVPILNVKYDADACGPYRDWETSENAFQATGANVNGFMICTTPPQTILEDGTDNGNFTGVAVYLQGDSVYLVSEMSAGWYRYASYWKFDANGTIHPRFGFAAVDNSCVCFVHDHHAYWRLDFDIEGTTNNVVYESKSGPRVQKMTETRVSRISQVMNILPQYWLVSNPATNRGYKILPGPQDGVADAYGRGDLWLLRYHAPPNEELDDYPNPGADTSANLDQYLTGESLDHQHIVVWYAIHSIHDIAHEGMDAGEVIGPDLVPVSW